MNTIYCISRKLTPIYILKILFCSQFYSNAHNSNFSICADYPFHFGKSFKLLSFVMYFLSSWLQHSHICNRIFLKCYEVYNIFNIPLEVYMGYYTCVRNPLAKVTSSIIWCFITTNHPLIKKHLVHMEIVYCWNVCFTFEIMYIFMTFSRLLFVCKFKKKFIKNVLCNKYWSLWFKDIRSLNCIRTYTKV